MISLMSGVPQLRFACDYRALNKIPMYCLPLPHLETVFDAIGDSKAHIFTNFRSAFWQVEMSSCSRHKARFITQDGVYEWKSAIRFDELTYFLSNTHV